MKERTEREEARRLYNAGKTYNEIASILSASKSTVSKWCGDLAEARRIDLAFNKERQRHKVRTFAAMYGANPITPTKSTVAVKTVKRQQAEYPFEDWWIYHYPNDKRDGRYRVQLMHKDNTNQRRWMSYARYRMCVLQRRVLERYEEVGYRDWDFTNNSDDNFLLMTKAENNRRNALRRNPDKYTPKECVICQNSFVPKRKTVETCSKECHYILIGGIIADKHGGRQQKECVICETLFTPRSKTVDTCSKTCQYTLISAVLADKRREALQET